MQAVKPEIQARAHVSGMDAYEALHRRSMEEPEAFWAQVATRLEWMSAPTRVMDTDFEAGRFEWFGDGTLNVSANCLDRHLPHAADKVAIIWAKDEVGEYERITYADLHRRVCKTANGLRSLGVQAGDRVCLYLPMVPELAVFMLACARIGAIHSVVFAGFSATALRDRIVDAQAKVVVTADEGLRGGRVIPLAQTTFEATQGLEIETIVVERTGTSGSLRRPGDIDYGPWVAGQEEACEPAEQRAEDPLFILYTSGSTGRPKGVVHSSGGYLVYASYTHELVFDLHEDDIYFCAADCGWITGHSYIVYGPLANGATTVMFESTPLHPDASRYWRIVEDLGVTIFYTAPTAIRAIARAGSAPVTAHDRSTLRVLGSVGEPINPEVWRWYHDVVGESRCAIVDTWWQTETGGIMITPLPGATPTKPGSATFPLPGVEPVLVDENNEVLEGNDTRGILCLARGWPGQARTIWGDHERFLETYYRPFPGRYFTGDGCERDADGYYWITGRVDDVINVSGHRLGTAEVESALVAHDGVAEAAVVGYPHPIKGTGIFGYVVTKPGVSLQDIRGELVGAVRKEIGPIATPDVLQEAEGLPKTRSGKIMRRILRKVAAGEYESLGDTSTLADPSVVERIVAAHKATSSESTG